MGVVDKTWGIFVRLGRLVNRQLVVEVPIIEALIIMECQYYSTRANN